MLAALWSFSHVLAKKSVCQYAYNDSVNMPMKSQQGEKTQNPSMADGNIT